MIKEKNIWKVGIYNIILLLFFMSDSIFEITLPIYLLALGHSFGEIGVMVATFGMGIVVFRFIVSIHSDKVGRKIYIIISLIGSMVTCFALPLGNSVFYFIFILIMRGAFRGVFLAVRAPLIKDLYDENERGKMLGLASAFSTIGSALGGLISGWLYFENNMQILFYTIGVIYFAAAIFSVFFLPSNRVVKREICAIQESNIKQGVIARIRAIPYAIKVLCIVNFIQNIVTPPLWSMILPVYFTAVMGMTVKSMGMIFTIDNILGVPSSILGGMWADKKSYKRKCIIFYLLCALIAFILPIQKGKFFFTVMILAFMTIFSIASPILEKIESVSARAHGTGFDLGLISVSVALGSTVGSILFGIIVDGFGFAYTYIFIAMGYLIMCILLSKIKGISY